ncbi:hypothetical protein [Marinoscillum furvescens]|uniref:Terminase family protein n=1 Tax=Marinoscillum furvescens DSM 4134 TaxID=1122208 RepID=A0A3D9L741_MARFU|nr:hypothetical protein [Marinoscillum furvescens]REE01120.1 hypothetical protein C7460_104140 [Marinoscillum furvescens DSM 4134]
MKNKPTETPLPGGAGGGLKRIHHNIPQILINMIWAQVTICIWGRATGKTEGPGTDFTLRNALTMPKSLGGIVSVTFDKMLMFIIPKLVKGWQRYGYIQDTHFWVRKFAPKELKREKPFLPVTDPKYFIHWFNGSGQQLISLDRVGISNASDLDYIYGDEARFFKEDNFAEVVNANRGNAEHFGHLSQHHSILLTTDMPRDQRGRWLFHYYDQVDREVIDGIMMLRQRVQELEQQLEEINQKLYTGGVSEYQEKKRRKVQRLIDDFESGLNELRKGTVFVSEASTLDNVDALGIDAILNFKRNLSEYVFRLSVLNERIAQVENGFYSMFDPDTHCYTATNYSYLDKLQLDDYSQAATADCRWYSDYDASRPLHISCDHNAAINWIVTGQIHKARKEARQLNAMYVERPLKIRHLIKKWYDYHKYHLKKNPTVVFWYDHTSVGDNASKDLNFAEEIKSILRKLDCKVISKYIGRTPFHSTKYEFWGSLLEGKREDGWKFMVNESTHQEAIVAIQGTEVKISGKNGFEKDKSKERDKNFPQVEAPHVTEAMDTLWWGLLESDIRHQSEFTDTMTG